MVADRAPREEPGTGGAGGVGGVYGWALRPAAGASCAGCGASMRAGYQLRRLTPRGWADVAGRQWCLRCWSGDSDTAGPAGRGLGIPPPREP